MDKVREAFPAGTADRNDLEIRLANNPSIHPYQQAMGFLAARRGQDEVNALVRDAVLESLQPGVRIGLGPDLEEQRLKELESDPELWRLNPGTLALGELIVRRRDLFSGPILTTNFDPHIAVSLRRAGGQPELIVLSQDGDPAQSETQGGIQVVYLHGQWRGRGDTLHGTDQLRRLRPKLEDWLELQLAEHVLIVLGYGGWQDAFTQALHHLAESSRLQNVCWALFEREGEILAATQEQVIDRFSGVPRVTFYAGVDAQVLLPDLCATLCTSPAPAPQQRHGALPADKVIDEGTVPPPVIPFPRPNPPAADHAGPLRFLAPRALRWAVGLVLGVILAAIALLVVASTGREDLQRCQVSLGSEPVHLGDNVFNSFGPIDPVREQAPTSPSRPDVVMFDKEEGRFLAESLSAGQEAILRRLSRDFASFDFLSYRHVRMVNETELRVLGLTTLPSPRVVPVGSGNFLVWVPDGGNFHQRWAAVLISYRADLLGQIRAQLPSNRPSRLRKATLAVEISHGGVPAGEGGEILLVVNGFWSDLSRLVNSEGSLRRETLEVDVTPWVRLDPGSSLNEFTLITTPVLEPAPVPGPGAQSAGARPIHFRDVVLHQVRLWADVRLD